ncbi:hypothetical protein FA95DRAFT_1324926 [Auriscalpium vulgare]|uniref:Uncharacterized protein n=1 Tax=Auriscalpium vulgare TaxID=40419 RepID=A0ACB8S834_9AGAM|nr:hypothetical protein FA95DRAFT_1324926 [Auriscalpium vulgare]
MPFLERISRSPAPPSPSPSPAPPRSSRLLAVKQSSYNPADPLLPVSRSRLDYALALTELAASVSNMLQFTPAAAAASILAATLKAMAAVKTNQERCMRIGERAARALEALDTQMDGRWDSAPRSLLENLYALESTLSGLHESMRRLSRASWRRRLLSKPQIEDTMQQCEARLDEALQAFQLSSLIQINFAVGTQQGTLPAERSVVLSTVPSVIVDVALPKPEIEEIDDFLETLSAPIDKFGFRRYHATEVLLTKAHPRRIGWFSDLSEARSNDAVVVVKAYVGPQHEAVKRWYTDIKRLRNMYHPRFPQLLGYSDGKTPTPFILLSSAPKQDVMSYMQASWTPRMTVTDGVLAWLRAYRDIAAAMLYVKQQLSLDDSQMKEFIRTSTYAIDHNQSLVIGLPVNIDDGVLAQRWRQVVSKATTGRTIMYRYLTFLERASSSMATKHRVRELIVESKSLVCGLIVFNTLEPQLGDEVLRALDQGDILPLTKLRRIAYARRGRQVHHYHTNSHPYAFDGLALGDIGVGNFKTKGGFRKAGNIFELDPAAAAAVRIVQKDVHQRRWMESLHPASDAWMATGSLQYPPDKISYEESAAMHCIHLNPICCAWMYCLKWARPLAEKIGVQPSQLRMVTQLGGPQPRTDEAIEPLCMRCIRGTHAPRKAAAGVTPSVRKRPAVKAPLFRVGFLRLEAQDFIEENNI